MQQLNKVSTLESGNVFTDAGNLIRIIAGNLRYRTDLNRFPVFILIQYEQILVLRRYMPFKRCVDRHFRYSTPQAYKELFSAVKPRFYKEPKFSKKELPVLSLFFGDV